MDFPGRCNTALPTRTLHCGHNQVSPTEQRRSKESEAYYMPIATSSKSEKMQTPEKLLQPPVSHPVWHRAWTWYQNKCIEWQLQRDELINGPCTRANNHNKSSRLLSLPAEIRDAIYKLAIEPEYKLQNIAWRHLFCVGIFDRTRGFYPDEAVLLVSRDVYRETRLMYEFAVRQFWSQSFLHLEVTQYRSDASW